MLKDFAVFTAGAIVGIASAAYLYGKEAGAKEALENSNKENSSEDTNSDTPDNSETVQA